MDIVFEVGRVMLAMMFVAGGLMFHLGQRTAATEAAKGAGVPLATIGVPLTGVGNVVGGLMVALGIWGDIGALILAVNVLLFAVFMHAFWKVEGAAQESEVQHFLKDVTICGGMLALFWTFNQVGADAPLTLGSPFFGPF